MYVRLGVVDCCLWCGCGEATASTAISPQKKTMGQKL